MKIELDPALPAERVSFEGINCYVAGNGPPVLLVHSVNAAASAAEVRPVFERLRATRTVYAVDLPGFGFSDRSARDYCPRLMTDALHATVAQIRRLSGGEPIDALAASLGCEFLARAAMEAPSAFRSLALVSPTGLNSSRSWRKPAGTTREVPGVYALLSQRLWAQWLYEKLTRPGVVRYFLERTWGSRQIDETMWAHAVRSARQPGARHAPLHFLSGRLFSADIHTVYESLSLPVWVSHGVRGDFTDFRALAQLQVADRWRETVFPTGALPYFEMPGEFGTQFEAFLRQAPGARSAPSAARRPVAVTPAEHAMPIEGGRAAS